MSFFNWPEFYPGGSWWHPRSLTCWRNVHSACTCKITVCEVTLALIQKICLDVEIGHAGNVNTRCCLTWPIRGCNRPGLWSWRRFPPFQHRLFLMFGRTFMVWKHREDTSSWFQSVRACVTWQPDDTLTVSILDQVWISIQFASVLQPSGPSKDASNGVGTGGSSLQREGSD